MMVNFVFEKSIVVLFLSVLSQCYSNDILGCGGFVKSHVTLDFSKIEIGLYTKEGSLKEKTECAPTNGYYFLPLEEKGEYLLKVHPPAGWSFEPSTVELTIDGETDQCSIGQDINFAFNGFGITGKVNTAGLSIGPSGVSVLLINDEGEVRNTVTAVGGDFHFTPVIPGKYTLKAQHSKWKLEPSQTHVQVREGNTALPLGVLTVKGYDVTGSITSFGNAIAGVHVLLYSKEENPKFKVEGCKTALLQDVPDAPICYSVTDVNGEFSFGLVPAGEYKLMAMSKSPGEAAVSYVIKPDIVPFSVQHGSIYIKRAFEVTGFNLVGLVQTSISGSPMAGVRVLLGGEAIATTDSAGKFTLLGLKPGMYMLNFQHEQCEFDDVQVSVAAAGGARAPRATAARWRVCGAVSPPDARRIVLAPAGGRADVATAIVAVSADSDGKWCTFLPPGVYSARVEVSEQELRDGLQFYPEWRQVTVSHAAVSGVSFSQLRATLVGTVECTSPLCSDLAVELQPLAADGTYVGAARTASVVDGKYTFEEVLPGSVEVRVGSARLCWREPSHVLLVAEQRARVPPFVMSGALLPVASTHALQVEYSSEDGSSGTLELPRGASKQCLPSARTYTLTPRGCHRLQPPLATVDLAAPDLQTVYFVAVSHAAIIRVLSPEPVEDLVLEIASEGQALKNVGPLVPLKQPQGYAFEHTLYLAEGEISIVTAQSSSLLFNPPGPQQVLGRNDCQEEALVLQAMKGLTLSGKIVPPVPGTTVTLHSEELTLSQVTGEDGVYSFGPLDAAYKYSLTAERESHVFSAPDERGNIRAHRLAEITVLLRDHANDTPLEGALVSVSGGSFRRNVASGPEGALRFGALSPAQYYVKPNMKEYKFDPPHSIVPVEDGRTHTLTFRGIRVAWSVSGRTLSLGKVGVPNVPLRAVPASPEETVRCPPQETTGSINGDFRIRGLLPNCLYNIELKESSTPELAGLKLAKAPPTLEVKEKDIENVRLIVIQPHQLTDVNVLVYTPNVDHYKTLRLSLALEITPQSPIYSTKLDPIGYSQGLNPGLMYVLPRLPADNKTYVVNLESTLSKATHNYGEHAFYFTSDGRFKHFNIDFLPKVRASEQELRHTSVLMIPLLGVLALIYLQRGRLPPLPALPRLQYVRAAATPAAAAPPARKPPRKKTQ